MEYALLIAFVLSNTAWLFYMNKRDKRDDLERYQLYERIQRPERVPSHGPIELVRDEPDVPQDELYAVGRINPPLPMREDDSDGRR